MSDQGNMPESILPGERVEILKATKHEPPEPIYELRRGAQMAVNGLFIIYVTSKDGELKKECRQMIDKLCDEFQTQ
jgi:hypothetical protein